MADYQLMAQSESVDIGSSPGMGPPLPCSLHSLYVFLATVSANV